jgi:predicted phage replisome organizer
MADVKWVKLTTDMFDNRKIKHLRRLPEGNSIVLIWVMLLTMAGRCNSGGMIFLTENIPYTPKMLADELDFEENTVQLALKALEQLNMIVTNHGFFSIAGWDEYQNIEGMDKIREQNRLRQAKFKAKQKELPGNVTGNVTLTLGNATEEDIEEDKDKELDIEKEEKVSCQQIVDLFNSICVSFPSVRSLSDARRKAIKARLNTYTLDDFKTVFENAEASSFLKGSNDRNWSANFDWLIKDANIAKVLEGQYADKGKRYGRTEVVPGWMAAKRELGEAEKAAIQRMLAANTADPAVEAEAEQLRQKMQEKYGKAGV